VVGVTSDVVLLKWSSSNSRVDILFSYSSVMSTNKFLS